jgi:hypothetical protein
MEPKPHDQLEADQKRVRQQHETVLNEFTLLAKVSTECHVR